MPAIPIIYDPNPGIMEWMPISTQPAYTKMDRTTKRYWPRTTTWADIQTRIAPDHNFPHNRRISDDGGVPYDDRRVFHDHRFGNFPPRASTLTVSVARSFSGPVIANIGRSRLPSFWGSQQSGPLFHSGSNEWLFPSRRFSERPRVEHVLLGQRIACVDHRSS